MSTISFEYNARSFSDPSALPDGIHPAFLLQVVDEVKPENWTMEGDRLWRFYFAVWDNPQVIDRAEPELQSKTASQKFTPPGRYQASNAYVFMKACLNRDIARGEKLDPNALVPLPCMLYITRTNKNGDKIDFANVREVKPWPEGQPLLTDAFTARLMAWWQAKQHGLASAEPPPAPAPTMAPTPPPAAAPGPAPVVVPAAPAKAGW